MYLVSGKSDYRISSNLQILLTLFCQTLISSSETFGMVSMILCLKNLISENFLDILVFLK